MEKFLDYFFWIAIILALLYWAHKRLIDNSPSAKHGNYSLKSYLIELGNLYLDIDDFLYKGKSIRRGSKKSSSSHTTTHANIEINGRLLPKRCNFGRIEVLYDGKRPIITKCTGIITYYETDGDIQVIYYTLKDEETKKFIGNKVDIYRKY